VQKQKKYRKPHRAVIEKENVIRTSSKKGVETQRIKNTKQLKEEKDPTQGNENPFMTSLGGTHSTVAPTRRIETTDQRPEECRKRHVSCQCQLSPGLESTSGRI